MDVGGCVAVAAGIVTVGPRVVGALCRACRFLHGVRLSGVGTCGLGELQELLDVGGCVAVAAGIVTVGPRVVGALCRACRFLHGVRLSGVGTCGLGELQELLVVTAAATRDHRSGCDGGWVRGLGSRMPSAGWGGVDRGGGGADRRLDHIAVQPIVSCDRADSDAFVDFVVARIPLPQGVRSCIPVLVPGI